MVESCFEGWGVNKDQKQEECTYEEIYLIILYSRNSNIWGHQSLYFLLPQRMHISEILCTKCFHSFAPGPLSRWTHKCRAICSRSFDYFSGERRKTGSFLSSTLDLVWTHQNRSRNGRKQVGKVEGEHLGRSFYCTVQKNNSKIIIKKIWTVIWCRSKLMFHLLEKYLSISSNVFFFFQRSNLLISPSSSLSKC